MKNIITKLALANVKNTASATYEFQELNVITGANFAGKTTVLQAIILASLGHLPALGKTNPATFQLSRSNTMTVQLQMRDGSHILRNWKQTGKQVKQTESGTAPAINFLAGEAFVNAKPADRLAMLASYAGAEIKELDKVILEVIKEAGLKQPTGETSLDVAAELEDALADEIKGAKARKVQFEKTLQGMIELAATPPAKPADTAAAMMEAGRKHAAAEGAAKDAEWMEEQARQKTVKLGDFLEEKPWAKEPPAAAPGDYETLVAKREQLRAECQSLHIEKERLLKIQGAAAILYDDDAARLAAAKELAKVDWKATLGRLQKQHDEDRLERDLAKRDAEALRKEIAELEGLTCCPTCGADGQSWKAKKLASLEERLEEKALTVTTREEHMSNRGSRLNDAERNMLAHDTAAAIEARLASHAEGQKAAEAMEKVLEVRRAKQSEFEAVSEELDNLKSARHDHEQHAAAHVEFLKLKESLEGANFSELQAAAATARQAAENAAAALEAAENAHQDADAARAAWSAHLGREQDIAKAQKEAEEESEKQKRVEAAQTRLQNTRDEQLRKLYEPVISVAAGFADGILRTPLTLHPTTAQIGRYAEGESHFIPFNLLSGAEQIIATAALQTALAAAGSGIVILDEISRMDMTTKGKFLQKLQAAQDMISQVILLDHDRRAYGEGWNVVEV